MLSFKPLSLNSERLCTIYGPKDSPFTGLDIFLTADIDILETEKKHAYTVEYVNKGFTLQHAKRLSAKQAKNEDTTEDTETIDLDCKASDKNECGRMSQKLQIPSADFSFRLTPTSLPNESNRLFIYGSSGVGKSTFIARFLEELLEGDPDKKIRMISLKDYDEAFTHLPPENFGYIPIKAIMEDSEFDFKEFQDCTLIFDDVNSISDKKTREKILGFRNNAISVLRSYNTDVICTSHIGLQGNLTNIPITNSNRIVFFNNSSSHQNYNFLKSKFNFPDHIIKNILKLKTRAVVIFRTNPLVIMSDRYIQVLN